MSTGDDHPAGGFTEQYGSVFATPGITEKGYLDVKVEVTAPGGHSSVPPKHTVSQQCRLPGCSINSAIRASAYFPLS